MLQILRVHLGILATGLVGISAAVAESVFAPPFDNVPNNPNRFAEETVLNLQFPVTAVAFTPDNQLIYLTNKTGEVYIARRTSNPGSEFSYALVLGPDQSPVKFIDLASIVNRRTDRGLLGIVVDPDFLNGRPYLYLAFVYDPPGLTPDVEDPRVARVVRVTADASRGYLTAVPNSTVVVVGKNSTAANIAAPRTTTSCANPAPASCMSGLLTSGTPVEDCIAVDGLSHSVGALLFDQDKKLIVTTGDGGYYDTANRNTLRALNLDSLSGKILRVDPDTGRGVAGNPFFDPQNPQSNRSKVWAMGLRNPFRIGINPQNGQIFAGDVGSSRWEEINVGKGANFGWPCYEGGTTGGPGSEGGNTTSLRSSSYENSACSTLVCPPLYSQGVQAVVPPRFAYSHLTATNQDVGGAVTGVAFYSGSAYPGILHNSLFYGDYARRDIRYLRFNEQGVPSSAPFASESATSEQGVVQLLSGPDQNIYGLFLHLRTGQSQLRRFKRASADLPPIVIIDADPRAGDIPLTVQFSSAGTLDPDGGEIAYLWDFGDGNTSTQPNPSHTYTQVGTFEVQLTVREVLNPDQESSASLIIRTGVNPPVARIDLPAPGTTYKIGDSIQVSGGADFPSGPSGSVSLEWSIIQHHNNHEHLVNTFTAPTGSFVIEEHTDNTTYEVCLKVSTSAGLQDQKCRALQPRTVPYTFASDPVGAAIDYIDEGSQILAPHVAEPIEASVQTISAAQRAAGRTFIRWKEDGSTSRDRTFVTGTSPTTFTAEYRNLPPTAQIRANALTGTAPLTVNFSSAASSDPEGEALQSTWTHSDGTTVQGVTTQRTFTVPGRYTIRLTVQDPLGETSSAEASIEVSAPPESPTAPPTPTLTPTEIAASSTPTATPSPEVTIQQLTPTPPATAVPVAPVPILSLSVRGSSQCGGSQRPCPAKAVLRPLFLVRFRSASPRDVSRVTVLLELKSGRTWQRITEVKLRRRKTRFQGDVPVARMRSPGLYRASARSAISALSSKLSQPRFLRK
jgi:PKD repeat protein